LKHLSASGIEPLKLSFQQFHLRSCLLISILDWGIEFTRYRNWSVLNPGPLKTIDLGNRYEAVQGIARVPGGIDPTRQVVAQPASVG